MDERKLPRCLSCASAMDKVAVLENHRAVLRCPECGLRSLWPPPTPDEVRKFYERPEYFETDLKELHRDLSKGYDTHAPIIRLYSRHLDLIAELHPPPADLFEVGCARGVLLDLARTRGYGVAGLELNPAAAAYAREQFGLDVFTGPLAAAPESPPHDVVVSFDVLEHIPDPDAFLEAAARMIKPGGWFVIGTPDAGSFLYFLAEALAHLGRRFTYPLYRFFGRGQEHLQIFTHRSLAILLNRHGFTIERHVPYGIPVGNMCALSLGYSVALRMLGTGRYETAYFARKIIPTSPPEQSHPVARK